MNMEIYKGKTGDGEWVKGNHVIDYVTGQHFIHMVGNSVNETDGEGCLQFVAWEVDPETVCRYSGLEDVNGRMIFEDDILQGHMNPNDLARVAMGNFSVIDVESLGVIDDVIGWHYIPLKTDSLSCCLPGCLPMPLTQFYIERCGYRITGNLHDEEIKDREYEDAHVKED